MDGLKQDLRYASRMIRRQPAFTALVVLTLALGIGANTAIFSVFSAVVLRPLPYPEPERLVQIKKYLARFGPNPLVSIRELAAWQNYSRTFSELVGYETSEGNLTGRDEAERITVGRLTANFFRLVQVQPQLGRALVPGDDMANAPPVAVLQHGLWKGRFGGEPSIIGRTITLDLETYTVVGVLPPGFYLPHRYGIRHDVWVPLRASTGAKYGMPVLLEVIGRLEPGVPFDSAAAELAEISNSELNRSDARVVLAGWQDEVLGDTTSRMLILASAVGVVLLIACANVASLLISRSAARQKELAVRSAIGAGRRRVFRQLLTESIVLAILGATLGLGLAFLAKDILFNAVAETAAHVPSVSMDLPVLAFTAILGVLTGVVFGSVPALRSSRVDLVESLKEGGRTAPSPSRSRLTDVLVVAEVTLALVLLIGAGLLLRTLLFLQNTDPGFRLDHVLMLTIDLTPSRYPKPPEQAAYFEQVLERVQSLPGVLSAGLDSCVPFGGFSMSGDFEIAGHKSNSQDKPDFLSLAQVSAGYFATMGIPLRRGRLFTGFDRAASERVAIINDTFARRYFSNEDPLGRQIKAGRDEWMTIVGVVADVRNHGLDHDVPPVLYRPYLQAPTPFMSLVVRTKGDAKQMAGAVRSQVAGVDRDQPAFGVRPLDEAVSESLRTRRSNLTLLGAFALLAALLAAVGIYAVVFYSVSQRIREIGIRMALGARRRDVLTMVVARSMLLSALGIVLGLGAAAGLTRFMSALIYGVTATDAVTFLVISIALLAVSFLASALPAGRATRVDPAEALRCE
jgi:putative ABC transport system permease protein